MLLSRPTRRSSTLPPVGSRRPMRRAARTRVSLTTTRSPGRSNSGRFRTVQCVRSDPRSNRAESRGFTGDWAIRPGGRSYTNSAVLNAYPCITSATARTSVKGVQFGATVARKANIEHQGEQPCPSGPAFAGPVHG